MEYIIFTRVFTEEMEMVYGFFYLRGWTEKQQRDRRWSMATLLKPLWIFNERGEGRSELEL